MFGSPTQLSTRSDQVALPGLADAQRFRDVLVAEASQDTWRIVELFTLGGGPFEAELAWSSGSGVGARARVTVSQATRVAVYARAIRVSARNLTLDDNQVGVTIADGQAVTRNQWEAQATVRPGAPTVVQVPPFARSVRLDLADPAALSGAALWLVDGGGVLRARVPADQQSDDGVLIGGAREIHLHAGAEVACRLVFDLTL